MPRQRQFESAAARQAAYRQRTAPGTPGNVTPAHGPNNVTKPHSGPPAQPDGQLDTIPPGTLCRHAETPGLIVRVQHALERNRVMALVHQPGAGNLIPGQAYPFKADNLEEVTG